LTQVLTGHGCFGEYLCRIKRERTAQCHHCQEGRNTAQHTLADCPVWDELRRVLVNVVGPDLLLPTLIPKMIGSDKAWAAVASFCEQVMSQKEAAERIRRQEQAAEEAAEVAAEAAADDVASDSGNEADGEEKEYAGEDGGGMVPPLHCPLCLTPPRQ